MSKEIRELKKRIETLEAELLKVEYLHHKLKAIYDMIDYLIALRAELKVLERT